MWDAILDVFRSALDALHSGLEPLFGIHAWGWAIIALTVIVRLLLLPLAIKQTKSMRAMQKLQPKIKGLQKKYKVDRDLMRKDPDTYRQRKQKLNEEMMALYKEEGVNPASGCLPLIAQAPIFIALFSVLRSPDSAIFNEPFYFFTSFISSGSEAQGLGATTSASGWPGWLLVVLMAATMFWSQRQMMNRNDSEGNQQQKIMMYAMPVFLAFISQGLPLGVLLYWVTTNVWQAGQQAVILREVKHEAEEGRLEGPSSGGTSKNGPSKNGPSKAGSSKGGSSKGGNTSPDGGKGNAKSSKKGGGTTSGSGSTRGDSNRPKKPSGGAGGKQKKNRDHLPRRGESSRRSS